MDEYYSLHHELLADELVLAIKKCKKKFCGIFTIPMAAKARRTATPARRPAE
jgi:hypothetical protein